MTAQLDRALDAAALTERERRVLKRYVERLREEMGEDLRALWLYGSRARGDAVLDESDPDRKSDIDLLAVAEGGQDSYGRRALELAFETAEEEGDSPVWYSVFVFDPELLRDRREIHSFFIQEVDRDKLILAGSDLEGDEYR